MRPAITVAIFGIAIIFLWWGIEWSLPIFCFMAAFGGFVIGFEWTLGIIYVNEQFPTEVRASGFGWSVGLGRIVSIAAPVVTQRWRSRLCRARDPIVVFHLAVPYRRLLDFRRDARTRNC